MQRAALASIVVLLASLAPAFGEAVTPRPIPRLERVEGRFRLLVDGEPFLVLGAQSHNSSASDPAALARFFEGVKALGANTAEAPVYWELLEPEPGRYDFRLVDALVAGARQAGVRLVVLWFASWKNGEMHYAPAWVKRDVWTYRRVVGPGGDEREILSPTCAAARDADARAFAALMRHLKATDEADRTVILVQVENETGLMGTDRDYSEEATRLFRSAVPDELTRYLSAHRGALAPSLDEAWARGGRRNSGTWSEVLGEMAAEAFSAWHVARYVDAVAAAGKEAYALPMYANAWLINPGDERAGRWPSGGPTVHVLDVWKAAAPHVDLLAPDFYQPKVQEIAALYARPDNPLFVPEIALSPHYAAFAFPILARFDGLGVAPFGVEPDGKGEAAAAMEEYARVYRVLKPLLPLVARHQGTGRLHAILQDVEPRQVLRLGSRVALVASFPRPHDLRGPLGGGLVVELAPDDLVVAGCGIDFVARDLEAPLVDPHQWATRQPVLSIDEGTFEGERWVPGRRLNGDERWVRLPEEGAILRVRLRLP
jgi:beta-galactosidase GanA